MEYSKLPNTINQQLKKLSDRGLIICNSKLAAKYLEHISYYRLVGYWYPMYEDKKAHTFKPNSKFEDVISLYNFDHELRMLLFDCIEKIEISLRTKLIYHISLEYDAWWFQKPELFLNTQSLIKTLANIAEEIDRSKDTFIKEHKKKYKDDLRFPPSWKTLELTSLGSLSKLYGNLDHKKVKSKDLIAEEYGTANHTYLPSWLQSIAQIRNYCAHHSRLWNRNLPGAPKLMSKPPNKWVSTEFKQNNFQQIYVHLCLIKYLLNTIQPDNKFTSKLSKLIKKYPTIDPNALGLVEDWEQEPLWN